MLDASVVTKWFTTDLDNGSQAAQHLKEEFDAGELLPVVPPLLFLELLNTAARRWHWSPEQLQRMSNGLETLSFDVREPPLSAVARWAGRGLSAYDASYVALAEALGLVVITTDRQILEVAGPALTEPLGPELANSG